MRTDDFISTRLGFPAVANKVMLHQLMGNEPLTDCPTLYHPTDAGLRALDAADAIVAVDAMDPDRCEFTKLNKELIAKKLDAGEPVLMLEVVIDWTPQERAWIHMATTFADGFRVRADKNKSKSK